MAIDYVEIRNENRELIGIIDTAISVIWHSVYYGVGDFEIYAQATPQHLDLLKQDFYVTRPNEKTIGIIERVHITNTAQDGDVIVASGRFAKSLLERRLIYNPSGNTNKATVLRGNVEANVRKLVNDNAINCPNDNRRNMPLLTLGILNNIPAIIVDENGVATEKQVSYQNLLTYTDEVLKEYELGSRMNFNFDTKKIEYEVYKGADKSKDVVFSQDFDNLIKSEYVNDNSTEKNVALIGGEGEGIARFYSLIGTEQALSRREIFVEASSINKKYKDENEVEKEYTKAEYIKMLNAKGKQDLSLYQKTETFTGNINVTFGNWLLNKDFFLGDVVTIQDNKINKYVNVRITEITEVQDENGYSIDAVYE